MTRLNSTARNRVAPMTTGMSFCRMAVVISVPIPGIAKYGLRNDGAAKRSTKTGSKGGDDWKQGVS